MQNEIQQAEQILINSGLFSSIQKKTTGSGWQYITPYFRARSCQLVSSIRDAEKVVKEIQDKIAPFTVGQGCSVLGYSDVQACRVIWVSEDGKRVKIQEDTATLLNGFKSGAPDALVAHVGGFCAHVEGQQRYDLTANPNGSIHEFSLRKNGEWIAKGDSMNSPCKRLSKSHYHYYDYNF